MIAAILRLFAIIRFGFCDIRNNQGRGKCYQSKPVTKTSSNNCLLTSEPSVVITPFLMLVDICSDLEDSVIVGNSINYLRTLRSWLSPVARSVNSAWKRCWHASVDGWAASTFHSRCDGKGPTVTIIRVGKYIFGGYTSISWGKLT